MTIQQMKEKRAALLREAEALRVNGAFPTDEARAAFDTKMTEVEGLDAQIAAAATPAPVADPAAIREAAIAEERTRVAAIQSTVRAAGLDAAFAQRFIDGGQPIDAVRTATLDELARRQEATETHTAVRSITMGEDARDKWLRGAEAWLLVRSGQAEAVAQHQGLTADKFQPGEFRGLTLLDLARESLVRAGQPVRGLDKMTLAGQAMAYRSNYQTSSDFATLLENAMHKVLRAQYGITPDTWSKFCGIGTVTDFRAHNWYQLGALSQLDTVTEHGEFTNKAIPDGAKRTFTATTKGNIIAITRQTIVNDDIGFVMRLLAMLGRAAKLTIEKAVYTDLGLNSGLGPTQSDSQPLFHSNRANVGTGAAISAASLDADRVLMASQTEPGGQDYTDLRPAVLLVPIGLEGQANVINSSQYDPDTLANKSQMKINVANGFFRTIIGTPRLSGTRRYLFADPAIAPVFLVSFLEGQQEPVLETQDGWRIDGVEMKARLDFGVDDVDYRGAVTNAGA